MDNYKDISNLIYITFLKLNKWQNRVTNLRNAPDLWKVRLLDVANPILEQLDTSIEKATGRNPELRSLYQRTRDIADAKARNVVNKQILPLWKEYGDNMKYVLKHAELADQLDRVKTGKIVGDRTVKDIRADYKRLLDDIKNAGVKLDDVVQGQQRLNNILRGELNDALLADTISKEQYDNFVKAHPNFFFFFLKEN